MPSLGTQNSATSPTAALTQTCSWVGTTTLGSHLAVTVGGSVVSGSITVTVKDDQGNYYIQDKAITGSKHESIWRAINSKAATNPTVTVTSNLSMIMRVTVSEFDVANAKSLYAFDVSGVSNGTGSAPAISLALTVQNLAAELIIGCLDMYTVNPTLSAGAGFTAIPPDVNASNQDGLTIYSTTSVDSGSGVNVSWGTSVSGLYRSIAVAYFVIPDTSTLITNTTAPDYRWSAKGVSSTLSANGLPNASFNGVNMPTFTTAVPVPFQNTGGTIMLCGTVGSGASAQIFGANDTTGAANGGYTLSSDASNNLQGVIGTATGGSDGVFNDGSTATAHTQALLTVVYALTIDPIGKTYRAEVNGAIVASGTFTGTKLVDSTLCIFAKFASGVLTSSGGAISEVRCWKSPQSHTVAIAAYSEMSSYPVVASKRYIRAAFFSAVNQIACIDFSDDATTFVGGYFVNYLAGVGDVRDVGLYYHKANNTFYAFHTAYISSGGIKFRVAKFSPSNPLQWTLHAEVDCTSLAGGGGGAPEPVVDPATGIIQGVTVQDWSEAAFHYLPITDITVPTFGSFTSITGTTTPVSDSFVLYPTDPRNLFSPGKYVMLWSSVPGGSPRWSDSTTLTGPYTTEHTTAFPTNYEGSGVILLDNGKVRWFSSLLGASTWEYLDFDGTTYSSPASVPATDVNGNAFDPGQGDVIDLKAIGLYPYQDWYDSFDGAGEWFDGTTATGEWFDAVSVAAPELLSATVSSDGLSIVLVFNIAGTSPLLPATSITGFTLGSTFSTISSASRTASNTITLTLNTPILAGQLPKVNYTPGNVTDSTPTSLNAFNNEPVTNGSAVPCISITPILIAMGVI